MDANTLTNANYYLADQSSANGLMIMEDSMRLNDYGQYVMDNDVGIKMAFAKNYFINYGNGDLDPTPLLSQQLQSVTGTRFEEAFKRQLLSPDVMASVHSFLYANKPKGNGLRILIYRRDNNVEFIRMVCEYLSALFGEDITFIDPQYRKELAGIPINYKGDYQKAVDTFRNVKKYKLYAGIRDAITNVEYGMSSFDNLEAILQALEIEQLFEVHEMLFPMDHLSRGEYTKERMIIIIMGKLRDRVHIQHTSNILLNDNILEDLSDDELISMHDFASKATFSHNDKRG